MIRWLKHKTKKDKAIRRAKYKLARKSGFSIWVAQRLRDWTQNHVDLFLRSNKK